MDRRSKPGQPEAAVATHGKVRERCGNYILVTTAEVKGSGRGRPLHTGFAGLEAACSRFAFWLGQNDNGGVGGSRGHRPSGCGSVLAAFLPLLAKGARKMGQLHSYDNGRSQRQWARAPAPHGLRGAGSGLLWLRVSGRAE